MKRREESEESVRKRQIVDMPVPKVVEEHVEIAKVSSRDRFQQRFEEQSVGQERISGRIVGQVVDVPSRACGGGLGVRETRSRRASFGRSSSKTPTGTRARLR